MKRIKGKMKVAFVLPPPMFKIAGGYKVVYQYANYLAEKGLDVTIFYDTRKGDNSFYCPRRLMFWIRKMIAIREPSWMKLNRNVKKIVLWDEKGCSEYKVDVLILTSIDIVKKFFPLYWERSRIVHFVQGHENWFLSDEEVYRIYRLPCNKIIVSDWVADIVKKYANGEVSVIKNGIDLQKFYSINRWLDRKRFSISMMYSSSPQKNSKLALSVITELKEIIPELAVTIFSVEKRTEIIPKWVDYHYLADEHELLEIYNSSQIYLCTSNFEGFGLSGLEAMACGCVLVSTDCIGVREYACDGNDALICPVGDKDSLKQAVLKIFNDEKIGRNLAQNAIKKAKEFDLEKKQENFFRRIKQIYKLDTE